MNGENITIRIISGNSEGVFTISIFEMNQLLIKFMLIVHYVIQNMNTTRIEVTKGGIFSEGYNPH